MEAREFTKRELRRNAAIVVAVITAFSCVLIFAVRHLDEIAHLANQMPQSQESQSMPDAETVSDVTLIPEEPFYVLLIGSDTRQGTAFYTGKNDDNTTFDDRADIMTLMRIDPSTHLITLVSVPRDTVLLGSGVKINDTLLGNNPESTVAAVERLTGVEIDYYMLTTFMTFELLVDALDGVTVDVPMTISFADPITAEEVTVKEGRNRELNGAEALVLARVRKPYGEKGDVARQENVRNLEMAIITKSLDNPDKLAPVMEELPRYVQTNMDPAIITALSKDFMANRLDLAFYSCSGPHQGGMNDDGVWVINEDMRAWTTLMGKVEAGEDPSVS